MSTDKATHVLQQAGSLAAGRDALRLQAEKVAHSYLRGPHGRKRAGQGEKFWQFRTYNPGDMPRDIDWRQTAKRDDVFVREREHDAAQSLWVYRDGSASMQYSSDKKRLTKAAFAEVLVLALSLLALEAGERVGALGTQGQARSHVAALPVLQQMLDGAPDLSGAMQVNASRAHVLLASDFYMDLAPVSDLCAAVQARGGRVVLLQVCDPTEEVFAFSGRVRFEDPEVAGAAPSLLVDDAAALRDDYLAAFAAHRAALQDIARRHHGILLPVNTAQPLAETLELCLTALTDHAQGRRA